MHLIYEQHTNNRPTTYTQYTTNIDFTYIHKKHLIQYIYIHIYIYIYIHMRICIQYTPGI